MQYIKFTVMIITSTLLMFLMMYLNTYAMSHLWFSETRGYMALYMGAGTGQPHECSFFEHPAKSCC
jgi:hypothetical protein